MLATGLTLAALWLVPTPVEPTVPVAPGGQWAAAAGVARVTGGSTGPTATAVCVGVRGTEAYLLTAAHVVPPDGGREYEFFTKGVYPRPSWSVVGGEILWRVEAQDVALVRVPIGDFRPGVVPLAPALDRPKRYPARLWAMGCPGGIPPKTRAELVVGRPLVDRPDKEPVFFWQTQSAPAPGMSGGPLLDDRGRVIGICAAASGGGGYYTHHDEIVAGLKEAGYGWLVPSN